MPSKETVMETIARSKEMIAEMKSAVEESRAVVDQCGSDRERMIKKRTLLDLIAERGYDAELHVEVIDDQGRAR